MTKEHILRSAMVIGSCILIGYSVYFALGIPKTIKQNQFTSPTVSIVSNAAIQLIDDALNLKRNESPHTYSGEFESPFKHPLSRLTSNVSRPSLPERPKLSVKGILLREKPLVILEDENRETYIRQAGQSALEQQIVSVKKNGVVLRDSRGTYELTFDEN